ncbi:MAG: HAMP domain-containing histidine kinase [Candidatus Obscuribacterales bacterium]|nr:HAMP domain-containing histidine kinase [Candidatus Obscuribacterales bacterium]
MRSAFKSGTLYLKVFNFLVIYVLLLFGLGFFFFNSAFGFGWDTFIASPLGERVDMVAAALSGRLRGLPVNQWDTVLKDFGSIYNVQFYIFDQDGQVCGAKSEPPSAVLGRVKLLLPPHRFGLHHPFPPELHKLQPFGAGSPPSHFKDFPGPPLPPLFAGQHDVIVGSGFPDRGLKGLSSGRFVIAGGLDGRFWIGTRMPLANDMGIRPAVLLAASDNIWQSSLLVDLKIPVIIVSCVLLFSLAFWYPVVYKLVRALSELTAATERIAEGNFDVRVQSRHKDELGRLAEGVNVLAARLDGYVSGQKRFLGDISHELRTPIARLQMALELLAESENLSDEDRKLVGDIREEITEMTQLVSELLAFSKAGLKGSTPTLKKFDLLQSVQSVVQRLSLGERVRLEFTEPSQVLGDSNLLERAISNVLRNAVRYAGSDSLIFVSYRQDGGEGILTIQDQGPGVSPESLPHLTEPFYRPESSRSRSLGGVGLGLAIVKSCTEASGGKVSIENGVEGGLAVTLRLKTVD